MFLHCTTTVNFPVTTDTLISQTRQQYSFCCLYFIIPICTVVYCIHHIPCKEESQNRHLTMQYFFRFNFRRFQHFWLVLTLGALGLVDAHHMDDNGSGCTDGGQLAKGCRDTLLGADAGALQSGIGGTYCWTGGTAKKASQSTCESLSDVVEGQRIRRGTCITGGNMTGRGGVAKVGKAKLGLEASATGTLGLRNSGVANGLMSAIKTSQRPSTNIIQVHEHLDMASEILVKIHHLVIKSSRYS